MAGIQDLIQSYAYGGPVRRYAAGDVVASTTAAPTPQPAFSSDPTINAAWLALAGKTGADITAQRQALAQQNSVYQTNQNLANMYGITQAPAQNQFLTDFNTAEGFDPTTSANLMKGMSDATTMANMNKEIGNSNFQYLAPTGNAYAPTASQTFEQALAALNAANPGKGAGNALMNQFTTGAGAADNPFLGQYNQENAAAGTSITPFTAQQLYNQQHPTPTPAYTPPLQQGQTVKIGDVFDTTKPINGTTQIGADGYIHVTTNAGEYLLNPNSKRVVAFNPSQLHAKGGTVGMPQEYSQGNWKLI